MGINSLTQNKTKQAKAAFSQQAGMKEEFSFSHLLLVSLSAVKENVLTEIEADFLYSTEIVDPKRLETSVTL